jgi:hypothetical protein
MELGHRIKVSNFLFFRECLSYELNQMPNITPFNRFCVAFGLKRPIENSLNVNTWK